MTEAAFKARDRADIALQAQADNDCAEVNRQWGLIFNHIVEPQAVKADREVAELRARLLVLDRERQELQTRLAKLNSQSPTDGAAQVVSTSSAAAKVTLFRRLFAGRTDVYPVRWENVRPQRADTPPGYDRMKLPPR